MAKKSDHRTLGDHDRHSVGHGAHVGCGDVTAAESQRHICVRDHCVEVTAGREKGSAATDYETSVQLCQLFDGPTKIKITYVARQFGMSRERIQNQGSGLREDGLLVSEREQSTDASSLSPFTRDFDREPRSENRELQDHIRLPDKEYSQTFINLYEALTSSLVSSVFLCSLAGE